MKLECDSEFRRGYYAIYRASVIDCALISRVTKNENYSDVRRS